MRKKIIFTLTVAVGLLCLTACGGQDPAKTEGPYLGFTPETVESQKKMDAAKSAMDGAYSLNMLRYDAAGYNKAVVRIEAADKDGNWKTVQEKDLSLQRNNNKGYMAVCINDGDGKLTINTEMQEIDDVMMPNKIEFDLGDYECDSRLFFGDNKATLDMTEEELLARTDDMDMSKKNAVILFANEFPVLNGKDEIISFDEMDDDSYEADINDIYTNKDGKFADTYKQNDAMVALTMEFVNDKELAKTPYIQAKGGKYEYNAGMYRSGLVTLNKSTPDGKWEQAGEEGILLFTNEKSIGILDVDVDDAFEKVTIGTGDVKYKTADGEKAMNEFSWDIPKGMTSCEYDTNSFLKPVSLKNQLPMMLFFDKEGLAAKDGISVMDFYKNKDGQYNDIYKKHTYYVVTIEALAE